MRPAVAGCQIDLHEQDLGTKRARDDGVTGLVDRDRTIPHVEICLEQIDAVLVVFFLVFHHCAHSELSNLSISAFASDIVGPSL
ncbi:hypothetical protein [Bradyrhizobium icense]|uniref:hypothetical protein n=1 Tax=Bradyrhizobium icense TaxID=1274631 RepID=UPI001AECED6D|nr:hypothetical protein [Bradyrhizobium icense]